jgi:hypothetical protein
VLRLVDTAVEVVAVEAIVTVISAANPAISRATASVLVVTREDVRVKTLTTAACGRGDVR